MTDLQWSNLLKVIDGKVLTPMPSGFIVDSPWLPKWFGIKIIDYFSNDELWLKANLHAVNSFPDVMFLPGFWSEFGMCSEPSAFGARCTFPANEFPHAHRIIHSMEEISRVKKPDPAKDGLAPFILNRLLLNRPKIEESGHQIYFSVSRGPLNIASYLMGTTELMTGMITHPEEIHQLIQTITDYLSDLHDIQKESIPTIDGILILDDIIGFIGEDEFKSFALPYFKQLFDRNVSVKFLHNDASQLSSISHLPEMGVNLLNMGFDTDLNDLKLKTGHRVTMLGNIPPRDVLAMGTIQDIEREVDGLIGNLEERSRIIASCGGGMPPEVTTEHIRCFVNTLNRLSR